MDGKKKKIIERPGTAPSHCHQCLRIHKNATIKVYKWVNEDEEFKKLLMIWQEIAIDLVESKLLEKIVGVTV